MLEVLSFNLKDSLIHDFREFALKLYSGDVFWTKTNEIYPNQYDTRFFLLKDKDSSIGRACAIINPDITYKNNKTGLIGFYECINNKQASKELLDSIFEYFKSLDLNYVIGPINGSIWKSYRFTELSDNPPFFLDNYNKLWYAKQFKDYGFNTIAQYSSTTIEVLKETKPSRIGKFEGYFKRKGFQIRSISIANFEEDLKKIYEISIASFKNNFLYTDITYEEFFEMYKDIKFFMDPELSLIAKTIDGTPCGFIFTLDNMFDKDKKSLVIKSVGTLPGHQYRGIGTFLVEKIHSKAINKGYKYLIHALMHEDNVSSNVLANSSDIYHTYSLFGKAL